MSTPFSLNSARRLPLAPSVPSASFARVRTIKQRWLAVIAVLVASLATAPAVAAADSGTSDTAAPKPSLHESFEDFSPGGFTELATAVGVWLAEPGHALIQRGHAYRGRQSLRLRQAPDDDGDPERRVALQLHEPAVEGLVLAFHAERWTAQDPFSLVIEARVPAAAADGSADGPGDWQLVTRADDIAVGGFHTRVEAVLPVGSDAVRLRHVAPPDRGLMIDDVRLLYPGPAHLAAVEAVTPVLPVFARAPRNPVMALRVEIGGTEGAVDPGPLLVSIKQGLDRVARVEWLQGGTSPPALTDDSPALAVGQPDNGRVELAGAGPLEPGEHWLWLALTLEDDATAGGELALTVERPDGASLVAIGSDPADPEAAAAADGRGPWQVRQRIGHAVRLPGDEGVHTYRIPALVQSLEGTLVAAYDVRHDHPRDLPADIDVGVSRSTDGGRSWEPMIIAMNMGNDPAHRHDGVGDPALLVDRQTGRIWLAALWSHGDRAWHGSGPGLEPEETGQLVLAWSDDDGVSWSEPVNITRQVKDPSWRLLLNGPGAGITLEDGTLVFPAQYRAADGEPHQGKPFSTVITSSDGGETWRIGGGVKIDTTEAQVVQLADGRLMINCRDNRGGSRTVAVSDDLGETWRMHPTDRAALREPVCMASLLRWPHADHGDWLWFSNPDSTTARHRMTVKGSPDQGRTWPESHHTLYDVRHGYGYSCLAPADDDHLGVLYEGAGSLLFLRLPLEQLTAPAPGE